MHAPRSRIRGALDSERRELSGRVVGHDARVAVQTLRVAGVGARPAHRTHNVCGCLRSGQREERKPDHKVDAHRGRRER